MPNVPAATNALRVLRLLARQASPMPAAAIARELDLPRSSVYHLLTALGEQAFVTHLPGDRRYALGVAAFELGFAYARQEPLRWIAAPVLARLVAATGHNGHVALLHGADVLYVVEERAPGRPSLVTDVGVRLPAHLTASGLAMLAGLPAAQLRALYPTRSALVLREGRGPRTLTELRRELAEVRRRGHATEDGLVTPGFASVAAAVADHRGRPVAAITLTRPAGDGPDEATLVDAVRDAAEAVRRVLARAPGSA